MVSLELFKGKELICLSWFRGNLVGGMRLIADIGRSLLLEHFIKSSVQSECLHDLGVGKDLCNKM